MQSRTELAFRKVWSQYLYALKNLRLDLEENRKLIEKQITPDDVEVYKELIQNDDSFFYLLEQGNPRDDLLKFMKIFLEINSG